jgi:hypothetical protein
MKTLPVSSETMLTIKQHVAAGQKINAIRALRADVGCGLRDAKYAVEHLMGEITAETAGVTIGPYFRIKSFQLECSDGVVEVDMEELKLKFLMELPEIGIDACGKLLELTEFVQKWQGNG